MLLPPCSNVHQFSLGRLALLFVYIQLLVQVQVLYTNSVCVPGTGMKASVCTRYSTVPGTYRTLYKYQVPVPVLGCAGTVMFRNFRVLVLL